MFKLSLPLLLIGCIKAPETLRAPSSKDLSTVAVLDLLNVDSDQSSATLLPEELLSELSAQANAHNIVLQNQPIPALFQQQRLTPQRLENLEAPSLLIETKAEFYSQLEGRFRWEVTLKLSLKQENGQVLYRESNIPVFHQFHHQREQAALLAAAPVIRREVRRLLDDHIRGLE